MKMNYDQWATGFQFLMEPVWMKMTGFQLIYGFTTNSESAVFLLIWVHQSIWYALHKILGFKLSWCHLDEHAYFKAIMEWAEYSLNFIPISESVLLSFHLINIFPPLEVKHMILTNVEYENTCLSSPCLIHYVFWVNTPPFSAKI